MRASVVLPCCRGCGVGSTLHMNCGMRKSFARERSRPATRFGSASAFQQMTFTPHTRRVKNRQALTPRTYAFRTSVPGRAFPEISYFPPPKRKGVILLGIKCSSSEQTSMHSFTRKVVHIAPQIDASDTLCPFNALAVTQEDEM